MFGFVAKGIEAGMENVCHVFAEYDPLQPCTEIIAVIQTAIAKQTHNDWDNLIQSGISNTVCLTLFASEAIMVNVTTAVVYLS